MTHTFLIPPFNFIIISIHTLRVEGDALKISLIVGNKISIHTLRVEGDAKLFLDIVRRLPISIHTLRVEGDSQRKKSLKSQEKFQSTPSVWRVTLPEKTINKIRAISIHTLRVEGDKREITIKRSIIIFQSTPSVWRVTR